MYPAVFSWSLWLSSTSELLQTQEDWHAFASATALVEAALEKEPSPLSGIVQFASDLETCSIKLCVHYAAVHLAE